MTEATRTTVTELATALGTLSTSLSDALIRHPPELRWVPDATWDGLQRSFHGGRLSSEFASAFANGRFFAAATEGLRDRPPLIVEWKGLHQPPGSEVVPADLRIDHVYQISCKYGSSVMQNAGPARLFNGLLATEGRSTRDWFAEVAEKEYQSFYEATLTWARHPGPASVQEITRADRDALRESLRHRLLPDTLRQPWLDLVEAVAQESAQRWSTQLHSRTARLRMLWRLIRVGDAPYFLLGTRQQAPLRLRVLSSWDWMQQYELLDLRISPRAAGQAEVAWEALIRVRTSRETRNVRGHIEVRWSHGRFGGMPEAKIYLETALEDTPGYFILR